MRVTGIQFCAIYWVENDETATRVLKMSEYKTAAQI